MDLPLAALLSAFVAMAVALVFSILMTIRVGYLKAQGLAPEGFELRKLGLWLWPMLGLKARDVADIPLRWMLRVLQIAFVWSFAAITISMFLSR